MGALTAGSNTYFVESCVDLSLAWMPWQKEPDRQCRHEGMLRNVRAVKGISITYFEYVSVALGIQHTMLMRHMVICDVSGCTIFSHIMS